MAKKLISDEEMDELRAKGCIGLCPICHMPLFRGQKHEDMVPAHIVGAGHELFDDGRNFF